MLPSGSTTPAGRRQHRRQQSTPSAAQARFSPYPSSQQRREAGHRRGMSLDLRQLQTTSSAARQEYSPNSNTNHAGLAAIPQHHALAEAQQHSKQARPGPGIQQALSGTNFSHNFTDSSSYLVSPHGTPQQPSLDPSCLDTNQLFAYFQQNANAMMSNGQVMANGMMVGNDFNPFGRQSPLSASDANMMGFAQGPSDNWGMDESKPQPRHGRRISNGIADQVSRFERMGMEATQRAGTPPIKTDKAYQPLTPTDTPQDRVEKHAPRPDRFSEDYDGSMEETIKPSRQRSNPGNLSIFTDPPQQNATSPFPQSHQGHGIDHSLSGQVTHAMIQAANAEGLSQSSNHGTPTTPHQMQYSAPFDGTPGSSQTMPHSGHATPSHIQHTPNDGSLPPTPSRGRRGTPHRRTESLASIQSAASIAHINLDETKMETGVTLDEIAQYISGPDLDDGRWTCLFEGCDKKFGRKENIKSHVQTHLNDRQFQCATCKKCFVRQHDLKRHAKIHTGVKPYPCECGNSFARHDALTRHRQRGMCVGAFEGIVKRTVKRGRPRKPRPDMGERQEKSARTRKKNLSTSSVSSHSFDTATDSSAATTPFGSQASPLPVEDRMLEDMLDLTGGAEPFDNSASSSAPMPTLRAHGAEAYDGSAAGSPTSASPQSYVSPQMIMDKSPQPVASPENSNRSHLNTPPPESHSNEASQQHEPAFLTVDADLSGIPDGLPNLSASSSVVTSSGLEDCIPLDYSGQDMRNFMAFDDNGLDSMDKFDDMFAAESGAMFEPDFNDSLFMSANH